MKLTEKSMETFTALKNGGGRVELNALADQIGRTPRSVGANVNDLAKKGLAVREKVAGANEGDKEITYIVLTDAGMSFVPSDEE